MVDVIHPPDSLDRAFALRMITNELGDQKRRVRIPFRGSRCFTELARLYEQFRYGRYAVRAEEGELERLFIGEGKFEFADCLLNVEGIFISHMTKGAAVCIRVFFEGLAKTVAAEEGNQEEVEDESRNEVY